MPTDSTDARKIDRGETEGGCPVHRRPDGVWEVRGYASARAVLRSTDTVQAGLGVETVEKMPSRIRRPVLYRDGTEHREHRRQTARYFTPRRVDEHYRDIMERVTDEQLAKLRADGRAQLSELSFHLAIDVASSVIGLTESKPGIQARLERFFPEEFGEPGFTSINGIYWIFRQLRNWLGIYLGDVRPAVRARKRRRQDDLISHLLDEGCSSAEILGECITFAAAGMVTTREFVNLAAWHLFTDEALRERYRSAEEAERLEVLHELLRLEPVVGHLRRRTNAELRVPDGDSEVTVPAGEVVDIVVSATNLDERVMGEQPASLCPGRELSDGAYAHGMSFGDGAHKCPGAHIAILETDTFLRKLFALPGVTMETPPRVTFNDAIGGYELRDLVVSVSAN
ncbi:cytochrome P450 [Saccharopolyspora erythraea NRRL 2338]|uniref:Cytochrome P450 n=3 Tax=Saccharopolyspora erythraea TaxID=1836 RepID=A4FEJ0_SACEN|nr:cytochrome P450 [Saccharopolyspora erythraea]PFG96190.1 cytochrome P450 [Saccharopolyspora erythraea NRRL 2338]QRK92722.1 cytochrome P450 [Saccharopolyspora erythraea]CAM02465.1 cytochrome P450 [Saccharopolyspora erythraea NRRL 2338]